MLTKIETAFDYISKNVWTEYKWLDENADIVRFLSERQYNKFFKWTWPMYDSDDYDANDGPFIIQHSLDRPQIKGDPRNNPFGWFIFYLITNNRPLVIVGKHSYGFQVKIDWSTTNGEAKAAVNNQLVKVFSYYWEEPRDTRFDWEFDGDIVIAPKLFYREGVLGDNFNSYMMTLMGIIGTCQNYGILNSISGASVDQRWKDVENYLGWQGRLNRVKQSTIGYVYLIKANLPGGYSSYKIGHSRDIENRLKIFNVKLPFEFDLIHLIETADMRELERMFHRQFQSKRVNGEWFDLSADDVEWIKNYKPD